VNVLEKGAELAPDRDEILFKLAVAYEKIGKREKMI
jgi:hypothetical protein